MLVKCMLPFSLVEHPAFNKWCESVDPSFRLPTRKTLKTSSLPVLKEKVEGIIKDMLSKAEWVNTSVDGWSDKVMRCYNGYVAQFIDEDWKLRTIPFAFEYVTGNLNSFCKIGFYFFRFFKFITNF